MIQYSEITYQTPLKLYTCYAKVDVQSILTKNCSSRLHFRAQALTQDMGSNSTMACYNQKNFENGKYNMIKTDHQKYLVIEVTWLVPDPFSKIIERGLIPKAFPGQ